jgi:phage-related holin
MGPCARAEGLELVKEIALESSLKLFGDAPFLKWAAGLAGAFVGYVFPEQATANAAAAAGALIVLDTITGVAAAVTRGKKITSKAFGRTLAKVLGYASVALVCAVVSRHVPGLDGYQQASVTGVVTLVILTEAISILENVSAMGINLPFGITELLRQRIFQERAGAAEPPSKETP